MNNMAHALAPSTPPALPRLWGQVGYQFAADGERVSVQVEDIDHARPISELSGTLALELWALPTPYAGEDFAGHALAGVALGVLAGGTRWGSQTHDLPITPPPAGTWSLSLMLREWTGWSYTTRDFCNFIQPVSFPLVPLAPAQPSSDASAVTPDAAPLSTSLATPLVGESPALTPLSLTAPPAPAHAEPPSPVTLPQPMHTEPSVVSPPAPVSGTSTEAPPLTPTPSATSVPSAPTPTPPSKPSAPATPAPDAPSPTLTSPKPAADTRVSINHATLDELSSLKGLSATVARALIAARPHPSLESLLAVKGIGEKLLARLRPFLRLD